MTRPSVARALGALALLAAAACGTPAPEPPPADSSSAVTVPDTATLDATAVQLAGLRTVRVERTPWRESWTAPARLVLDPAATQQLGAVAEGRVTRVLVRVGDSVRAGQLLATLHGHELLDARGALAKARAAAAESETALGVAESALARAERLHALRALSTADLERARAARAQALAARDEARAELARADAHLAHLLGDGGAVAGVEPHEIPVRSPITGVVVAREAQPGAVVLVGAPLLAVSRTTSLLLTLQLPERALGAAVPGADVRFTVPAFPADTFQARVQRVAPTLDPTTRTVEVEARVLAGAERLRAEMFATAELLGPAGAPTLAVPAVAVQEMAGDTVVITAVPCDSAALLLQAVPVRVGRRTVARAEILDGLRAGTAVVTDGAAIAKAELLRRRGG